MKVLFHDCEEFLAELAKDSEWVYRKIARVTTQRRMQPHGTRDISVIATAAVGGHLMPSEDSIIREPLTVVVLDRYVGNVFFPQDPSESDKQINETDLRIAGEIERRAQELGLLVRAGVYEE